ncbi:MAG: nucleotidyltransferase family protein [Conexibacter sp.]
MRERALEEWSLALALAGTAERRALMRPLAAELLERVDVATFAALLSSERLLPLLGARAVALAGGRLPPALHAGVAEATARAARAGEAQETLTVHLVRALDDAGIRAIPLKGPLLGRAVHGGPGMRIGTDVDLLVHTDDLAGARETLVGLGYDGAATRVDARGLPVLHHALKPAAPGLPPIDLHWRVHWYEEQFGSAVVERCVSDPLRVWRAQPADELAMLLLMYARDGFVGLRLAVDLAAWWDALGASVPDGALAGIAADHPALEPALRAACGRARAIVGVPELLPPPSGRDGRARAAERLANWSCQGSNAQALANVSLIDALLMPRGQLRAFAARQLARTPSFGTTDGERRPPLHALRVLLRHARAGARIAAGRPWSPLPRPAAQAPAACSSGCAAPPATIPAQVHSSSSEKVC